MAAIRPKAGVTGFARSAGFTMIELMMTIAIATIVMTLAIPSFRYITNANRIAGEVNGLLGDMQFARAEAIKEGQGITVCASTNGLTCTAGDTFWHNGWIVISSVAAVGVLRVQSQFSSSDTFESLGSSGISTVTFNREGYATGLANGGSVITLHDSTSTTAWTRCLALTFSGQMTTEKYDGTSCT